MERRTIGERGQIVLPKKLREHLGLKPGKRVIFEVKQDTIILKPEKNSRQLVEEFVSVPKKLKKINIKNVKRVLEEEYEIH